MNLALLILGILAMVALLSRWLFRRVIRQYTGPRWLVWVGVVLILLGGTLTIWQSIHLTEHRQMRLWPTTDGLVTDSEVVGERSFHPEVVYTYSVAGQTYEGVSTLLVPGFGGKRKRDEVARKEIANYWPGRNVTVYYNPEQPSVSRLNIRLAWSVYGQLGFGGTMFLLGVLMLLWPRRSAGVAA